MTFMGAYAGNQTSGTGIASNTFVGSYAGMANMTGSYNTFLGAHAGHTNTTGHNNVFIGLSSGYLNDYGNYNIFVGQQSGSQHTSGNYNVFIGNEAGGNNALGAYNVFLGNNAGLNETGSNKLYIDNSPTSTPLIYGEFDNNLVVINGLLSIASGREYKENIDQLRAEEAIETLQNLKPVKFSYKVSPGERHAGFISEEVPESLTARDRKAVSPMDVVAVLTKVVQEQQRAVEKLRAENEIIKGDNASLKADISSLAQRVLALEGQVVAGK